MRTHCPECKAELKAPRADYDKSVRRYRYRCQQCGAKLKPHQHITEKYLILVFAPPILAYPLSPWFTAVGTALGIVYALYCHYRYWRHTPRFVLEGGNAV